MNEWKEISLDNIVHKIKKNTGRVILGIDGIRDQVWQVLRERQDPNNFTLFEKMLDFGQVIVERKEGGLSQEIIKKRSICGGFTSNTGRALGKLKLQPTLIGLYGETDIHPDFAGVVDICQLISIGSPVTCNILEFEDGKIMLPNLQGLLELSWEKIVNILGLEQIKRLFMNIDIVSIGYWTNMPDFNNILTGLQETVFSPGNPARLFFDFGNISKRSKADFLKTIEMLAGINREYPLTISLNQHEARLFFAYYNLEYPDNQREAENMALKLSKKLKIDEIVIHTPYYALAATGDGVSVLLPQYHCEKPVRTTGAGDTFNGGYMAGYLFEADILERLALANAATSFYVQNGFPPDRDKIITEITQIYKSFQREI